MTISTTQATETFLGNGATTVFSYTFVCDAASEFQLLLNNADGTSTPLAPVQYTLFLNPPASGSLHSVGGTVTYPLVGPPIPTSTSLAATRALPYQQLISINNQGDFSPQVTEEALDNNTLLIQQVAARTGLFRGTWQTATLYNYADIVQDGAAGANTLNYYLSLTTETSGVWATDLANGLWTLVLNVQQVEAFAVAAAASAAAAAASASTASTEAGIATTAAGTATAQAAVATTAAATATTEATAAGTSATNAASSATAAANSATNSATSATASAASATAAAASDADAATQAANAAASAAQAGSTFTSTSTTTNTIGLGNLTFTTQANKNYIPGQFIVAAVVGAVTFYVHGQVFSYSGTTLVIEVTDIGNGGTFSNWNIGLSGTGPYVAAITGGTP